MEVRDGYSIESSRQRAMSRIVEMNVLIRVALKGFAMN